MQSRPTPTGRMPEGAAATGSTSEAAAQDSADPDSPGHHPSAPGDCPAREAGERRW